MKKFLAFALLACFVSPASANDFQYEAEAALAYASALKKPVPTPAPTVPDVKQAPCEFCKALPNGCGCGNCGCDAFHNNKKAGAVPAAQNFPAKTGLVKHAGHDCPSCHYESYPATYNVRGPGPERGTHVHSCPRCGQTWYHN